MRGEEYRYGEMVGMWGWVGRGKWRPDRAREKKTQELNGEGASGLPLTEELLSATPPPLIVLLIEKSVIIIFSSDFQ